MITRGWRRLVRKAKTARFIVNGCGEASRQFGANSIRICFRFLRLYAMKFSPTEIFLWGLLDPTLKTSDLNGYVSKESLLRMQRQYNPNAYVNLVEDKIVFYSQCAGIGLPVPRTLAIFTRHGAWLNDEKRWVSVSELLCSLESEPEEALVVKPANGVYGQGVQIIWRHKDRGWIDDRGEALTTETVERYCATWSQFNRFLVQEKVHNHDRITGLTGIRTLQTVRVITVAPRVGEPGEIVLANWRIAGCEATVDNFDYGRSGNLLADVEPANGKIKGVVGPKPDRQGVRDVHRHPLTGADLMGVCLPHWQEVRVLVVNGMVHFAPLRLIGWDIALSEKGPCVIEANAWFDAGQNAFRSLPQLVQRLGTEMR